jgi:hypothetical protein
MRLERRWKGDESVLCRGQGAHRNVQPRMRGVRCETYHLVGVRKMELHLQF